MQKIICLILGTIFLASCAAQPQDVFPKTIATPDDIPATILIEKPTSTSVFPGATLTAIYTPLPTHTKQPMFTPNPMTATAISAIELCSGNHDVSKYIEYRKNSYSSNNSWIAMVCQDNGVYTKVSNSKQGIVWNIPAFDDGQTNSGLEWYWLPYLWSGDGKYLYLQPVCLCFIDSPWLIYSSGFGLSRLNLETGQADIWLKPNDSFYSFELTQDGELFAFSPPDSSHVIKIRDLISDEEQSLSFKEKYSILEYRWTPDKSRLVIFTEERGSVQSENGFSIFVYDISTEILKKLVDKNNLNSSFPTEDRIEPRIYISELSNGTLMLSDIDQENNFQLDIQTGELTRLDK